jgi:hypothetical protein
MGEDPCSSKNQNVGEIYSLVIMAMENHPFTHDFSKITIYREMSIAISRGYGHIYFEDIKPICISWRHLEMSWTT